MFQRKESIGVLIVKGMNVIPQLYLSYMPLSLLTWNLAGDALPYGRTLTQDDKSTMILAEIRRCVPDILLIQESCFSNSFWTDIGYARAGLSAKTHGDGVTEILYNTSSCRLRHAWNVPANWPLPFAGPKDIYDFPIARFDLQGGTEITVVSVHLAAGTQGAQQRSTQLRVLKQSLKDVTTPLIIAGDTNMRESETRDACTTLACHDAFIEYGSPDAQKFTWDSFKNCYYENGIKFKARFDRVFCKNLTVSSFRLVGNVPVHNSYASDHFGLFCELTP